MERPRSPPNAIPRRISSAAFSAAASRPNQNHTIIRPFSKDVWEGQNGVVPPPPPPKPDSPAKRASRSMAPLPPEPQTLSRAANRGSNTVAEGRITPEMQQQHHNTRHPLQAHPPTVQTDPMPSTSQPSPPLPTPTADHLIMTPSPSSLWTPRKEAILLSPYTYMHNHPGKDIRTQLISAFNAYLKVPAPALAIITRAIGMLHTSSLLVDDVEDSSQLRRGVPVAHSIFGIPQTLNSANYIYFLALNAVMELGKNEAVQIFTEEMVNLHRGQGMDLWWRDSLICPTEGEYLEMVSNKTGGLFRLAVKLMLVESTWGHGSNDSERSTRQDKEVTILIPLVNTIGLLFQVLDDYRNLSSGIYTTNKGLAEDLTEGKFSFPIIHAIRSSTTLGSLNPQSSSTEGVLSEAANEDSVDPNNVLLNILRQKTTDDQVKHYALKYMEDVTHSFAYTRDVLRLLTSKALSLIDELDEAERFRIRDKTNGWKFEADRPSKPLRAILEKLDVDMEEGENQKPPHARDFGAP